MKPAADNVSPNFAANRLNHAEAAYYKLRDDR
jgi:hypothetical protein